MKKKHKILAVDDDELILFYFSKILKSSEIELVKALSGNEALEIAKDQKDFSLILMDIHMSEMDGYETLERLKKIDGFADIPVILITAHFKSEENINRGFNLGASDYILKPIDSAVLKNKIKVLLKVQLDKKELENRTGRMLQQKEFISKIIETIPSYLIVLDENKNIVSVNVEENIFSGKYSNITFNSIKERLSNEIACCCKDSTSTKVEIEFHGSNREYYFEAVLSGFKDHNSKCFVLITLTDISPAKKSEKALSEQLNLLKTLIQSIPGPVFYKDVNGIYLGCNQEFERFIGKRRDEIIGYSVYDISPKELADKYYEMDKKLLDNPGSQIYETNVKYVDGSLKDILFYKSTFNDPRGKTVGLIGVMLDISERKKTEKRLLQTNRSLKMLSECNMALLAAQNEKELYFAFCEIITRIGEYPYVWISKVKEDDSNKTPAVHCMAESGSVKIPYNENICSLDDNICCPVLKAARSMNYVIDVDFECCWKCGINIDTENFQGSIFVPVKSKSKHTGTVNIFSDKEAKFSKNEIELLKDISDYLAYGLDSLYDKAKRRKIEEQLANEKEELSITLKNIADGVITTKQNGEILLSNRVAREILDLTNEEVKGKTIFDAFQTIDNDNNKVMFNPIDMIQNKNKGESIELQLTILTNSGKRKILEIKITGIRDLYGNFKGIVLVFNDITEQLIAETQKALSQKMESIGQLASGIAHEINTPLQFVGDNTFFLKDGFESLLELIRLTDTSVQLSENFDIYKFKDEYAELKEEIDFEFLEEEIPIAIDRSQNGIERVSKIVKAMKSFAHPSGKKKTLSNINKGIEVTTAISKNEWKYAADLTLDLAEELPLVLCSLDEINQVILNMIINAAHAIEEKHGKNALDKGTINIQTGLEEDMVFIKISDSGKGIEKDKIDRIFDPFFTTKEVGKGTGQGLAISHDVIVEKHNGKIIVESEIGKGTTFKIFLPAEKENENEK